MSGTSEGTKKQDMSEKGRKGSEATAADPQAKSAAAQKGADTRKRENPEAFREMGSESGKAGGAKGGAQSQGGGKRSQENE